MLFALHDVANWTDSEVYRYLGAPRKTQLLRMDGSPAAAPREVVEGINFRSVDPKLLSGQACIVDFGLSFRSSNPPPEIPGISRSFLAPELCFGYLESQASDVWSLGCVIFELHSSRVLFPLIFDQLDLLIGTIVDTLGNLPDQWEGRFVNQADRRLEPGQKDFWYDPSFAPGRALEKQIKDKCPQISEQQRDVLLRLLRGMLSIDPVHRLSAADMASHPYLQSHQDL